LSDHPSLAVNEKLVVVRSRQPAALGEWLESPISPTSSQLAATGKKHDDNDG